MLRPYRDIRFAGKRGAWGSYWRRWSEVVSFDRSIRHKVGKRLWRSTLLRWILGASSLGILVSVGLLILGQWRGATDVALEVVAILIFAIAIALAVLFESLVRAPIQLQLQHRLKVAHLLRAYNKLVRESSRQSSFEVEPRFGDAMWNQLAPDQEYETVATLRVRNRGPKVLEKCSVRVIQAVRLMKSGLLWDSEGSYPSIQESRNESFLLRWSLEEPEAYGEYRQWIDIPPDGSWRVLDVALVDHDDPDLVRFVSANPQIRYERCAVGNGWWKVDLRVASESDDPNTIEIECLLGYENDSAREGNPITFCQWKPRGENILSKWRSEFEKRTKKRRASSH